MQLLGIVRTAVVLLVIAARQTQAAVARQAPRHGNVIFVFYGANQGAKVGELDVPIDGDNHQVSIDHSISKIELRPSREDIECVAHGSDLRHEGVNAGDGFAVMSPEMHKTADGRHAKHSWVVAPPQRVVIVQCHLLRPPN